MMYYRRFGRTELQMPVLSCGGMRYQQTWGDLPPEEINPEGQQNLETTIHRALELGINHIETARGYGTSEMQLGWILPKLPREKMIVQTKVGPTDDAQSFYETFNKSLDYLKLDYVDLLAFHGINTPEILEKVLRSGGCMEAARKIQKEGRARFIGFSTHGPCSAIKQACATGEFDYVNVHWYFVNELNWPAIEEATRQDMGVFIISPTDKGGMLQAPSEKMVELCKPLTPMGFNDLWCLSHPQVHTLSIGAARPTDFDAHVEALQHYENIETTIAPVEARIREEMIRVLGREWCENWWKGVPEATQLPNTLNVLEISRLYTYAKPLELIDWAKGRYNMFGNADHWFPGSNPADFDEAGLMPHLQNAVMKEQIPGVLRAAHELLAGEAKQRLSQS